MVFQREQQYNYEKKDGTKVEATYKSYHDPEQGISAGQKTVIREHPDGTKEIEESKKVTYNPDKLLPNQKPPALLENKDNTPLKQDNTEKS
jgi:hypothetical protein